MAISIQIVDGNFGSVPTVTLTVTNGTLTLGGTTNLTFTSGSGAGDATMTFSGTVGDINNALATVTYQPTNNYFGADTLQITTTDNAASPASSSNTVNLTVSHVNAVPVNTVPGPQTTNENTALVFSSGNGNLISVSDPAAGNSPLQETLTATNGTLTLNGTTGLTFTSGTGTGDATMTFTGTITDINNALDGLSFQPTGNYFARLASRSPAPTTRAAADHRLHPTRSTLRSTMSTRRRSTPCPVRRAPTRTRRWCSPPRTATPSRSATATREATPAQLTLSVHNGTLTPEQHHGPEFSQGRGRTTRA